MADTVSATNAWTVSVDEWRYDDGEVAINVRLRVGSQVFTLTPIPYPEDERDCAEMVARMARVAIGKIEAAARAEERGRSREADCKALSRQPYIAVSEHEKRAAEERAQPPAPTGVRADGAATNYRRLYEDMTSDYERATARADGEARLAQSRNVEIVRLTARAEKAERERDSYRDALVRVAHHACRAPGYEAGGCGACPVCIARQALAEVEP